MEILDEEGAFKGELVLNPKEVFLECGERFDLEGGSSTHGYEIRSIQWDHGTRVDRDGEEDLCTLCGAPRDHDLEGREVTWIR
jgi:uncharacterized Zn finger protein